MNPPQSIRLLQRGLALVAIVFGVATCIAGTRVLTGSNPGYSVFQPLLIYNTVMGLAYIAAGIIAWRNLARSRYAAAVIFLLNALVLGVIGYLSTTGDAIAAESLRAMTFRTIIWLALFLGLVWASHRSKRWAAE